MLQKKKLDVVSGFKQKFVESVISSFETATLNISACILGEQMIRLPANNKLYF